MLEKTWIVDAGGSWHGDKCSRRERLIQQFDYVRPLQQDGYGCRLPLWCYLLRIRPSIEPHGWSFIHG
jgi:hypothetical protein